ncbi:MAG: sigma-70 family RNA polymerase sigma factor [Candidatus Omnitrophica bacterium]|nr:sigma-70 family RNA polymerase sigma factor [Candidatus Omnitrophota bacterium]
MRPEHIEDDSPLVEACINKDAAAWAKLVKKYTGLISAAITNRLKKYGFNPLCEDTEDIRQNILASIWTGGKLEQIRNRKSIAYWLAIVSGNAAIEHMRRKKARRGFGLIPLSEAEDAIAASGGETPERRELAGKIEQAIESLAEKERLVIKLNLLHGMEYREISEMLGMPKGTVASHVKRAKDKLKKDLKGF